MNHFMIFEQNGAYLPNYILLFIEYLGHWDYSMSTSINVYKKDFYIHNINLIHKKQDYTLWHDKAYFGNL